MDILIYNLLQNDTGCKTNAASKHTETEESKDEPISTFSILVWGFFCFGFGLVLGFVCLFLVGFLFLFLFGLFRPNCIYKPILTVTLYLEL